MMMSDATIWSITLEMLITVMNIAQAIEIIVIKQSHGILTQLFLGLKYTGISVKSQCNKI